MSVPGRLAHPSSLSASRSAGIGDGAPSVSGTWDISQLGEVSACSIPESTIPRGDPGLHSFQGFSLPAESREAMLNRRRIPILRQAARLFVEKALRNLVFPDLDRSRGQVTHAIPSTSAPSSVGSDGRFHLDSVGSGVSSGSGMVGVSGSSAVRHISGSDQPSPRLLVRRLGRGVGGLSSGCDRFRPMVSGGSSSINQCQGAAGDVVRPPSIPTPCVQLYGGSLCRQFRSSVLPPQTRGHSVATPQLDCAEDSPLGGVDRLDLNASVYPRQEQCSSGLLVSSQSSPGLRVDSEVAGISGAEPQVAGDDRSFCHFVESPLFTIFFALP